MADRVDRRNWRSSDFFTLGIGTSLSLPLYVDQMVYLREILQVT